MTSPVLCIDNSVLPSSESKGIKPFDLLSINNANFHFIHRNVVDDPLDRGLYIGSHLPQILPYIIIKCDDHYLSYSRIKGTETRLQDKRSIGFGGHVDLADFIYQYSHTGFINYAKSICKGAERELIEELDLHIEIKPESLNRIIVDVTDNVGLVHRGLPLLIEVSTRDLVIPNPDEINDPIWKTREELIAEIDIYENWSQLLIQEF